MKRWPTALLLLLGASVAGCDGCGAAEEPLGRVPAGGDTATSESSSPYATIRGRVVLAAGAELPVADNPMLGTEAQPELPEGCTPPVLSDRQTVRSVDGGLTGIVVALHDFSGSPEHEPVVHELAIRDCRLSQPILAATIGDTIRLTNETDYPFLPTFGSGVMQALLHGESREMGLAQGGGLSLTCGFAAPCGRTEVITLYHPLHAVTDDRGEFVIPNAPAGQELRIGAWHPLFQEANETLTPVAGETHEVELVLTPRPPAPPPPPPSEGHPEDNPDILF